MKNFLKLTVSFLVSNIVCSVFCFAFEYYIDLEYIGLPIIFGIYTVLQIFFVLIFKFNYDKSLYISLAVYAVFFFYVGISSIYDDLMLTDLINVIFGFPDIMAANIECDFTGVLEHPIFSIMLCLLVAAYSVLPMSIKPLYNLWRNKKNQKSQWAE